MNLKRHKAQISIISGILLLALGGWAYISHSSIKPEQVSVSLLPNDSGVVSKGKEIYAQNCASCHGKNLQGQVGWQNQLDEDGHRLAPPLNGAAHTWHHSPEYLYRVIKYGFTSFDPNYEGKMLGNSGLSDEEVWELVSYMKEVWPNEIKEVYENRFGS